MISMWLSDCDMQDSRIFLGPTRIYASYLPSLVALVPAQTKKQTLFWLSPALDSARNPLHTQNMIRACV
jgi:hypothetical protein